MCTVQLQIVLLPIDKSGEMQHMLDQYELKQRRAHDSRPEPNFGVSFMSLSEAENYHPLVAATLACEDKLVEWHGHRSHAQQAKRLQGHNDGCLDRPDGPGKHPFT